MAVISTVILSGCASLGAYVPKATVDTNIPFFYHAVVKVYNSAGQGVVLVPQSRGNGFVAEYRYGKRMWQYLWLCREKIPTKLVTLAHGESMTLPLPLNTGQQAVRIPFAVKVIEKGKVLGFYNACLTIYPGETMSFDFNFGRRELQELKDGYTGNQCNRNYW